MKTELSAAIAGASKSLLDELTALPNLLRKIRDEAGRPLPLTAPIPERGETIIGLITRAKDVARLGARSNLGEVHSTVPNNQLQIFRQKIEEVLGSAKALSDFAKSNQHVQSIDQATLVIVASGGSSIDIRGWLYQIYDRLEELLGIGVTQYLLRRIKDRDRASDAREEIRAILNDTSAQFERAASSASAAQQTANEISAKLEELRSNAAEIARLSEEAQKDRKSVQDYASESSSNFASIKQISQDAASLEAAVSSYRPKFEQFQNELDDRTDEIADGNTKLAALLDALESQEAKIVRLTEQGEEMLSLTTTAGLSSNYLQTVNKLTRELLWSRVSFYTGIAVLFVSAAPLFANAIIPLLAAFYPDLQKFAESVAHPPGQEAWQYAAQVFARLIILVPAAWLVSFSAKRHSSLFKLREHYAYKYSLAASVEGFKKEASKYGDEIAATVFTELSFNPAERLDHSDLEAHKAPNPFLQKLLDLIQGTDNGAEKTS